MKMHFGEPMIRKAVPLAIGLLYASNPQLTVFETLSRYSHDSDLDVAVNAIFAMGLVGAGTNNARLAQLLRGLASYYYREANCLFMVRIAQGMLHLGKGTMTLNPYHTDRQVLSRVSIAGLLPILVAMMDSHQCIPSIICSNCSYSWKLSLDIVLFNNCYATSFPDYFGRGIE
jgi:26S proteasome regulatory subunit N1